MTSVTKSLLKLLSGSAIALTLATSATPTLAHDDAHLGTLRSVNGGQLRVAGIYQLELVMLKGSKNTNEDQLVVYVTDHAGTKIPSAGASATATILTGKVKTTANLISDGDNRLKGTAKYASDANVKVVLAVSMPGKSIEQARFTPFAAVKDEHMDHKH